MLFHFSEEPDIPRFEPRLTPRNRGQSEPFVWAIDEFHAPMYYVPRDCPRACFWPGSETSEADRERWFGGIRARMVIAIEAGWLEPLRATSLFRYVMPEATFELHDATAGHWASRVAVTPVAVEPVGDLLTALISADIELRFTPRLGDLWRRVVESTLEFSGTSLRNARD